MPRLCRLHSHLIACHMKHCVFCHHGSTTDQYCHLRQWDMCVRVCEGRQISLNTCEKSCLWYAQQRGFRCTCKCQQNFFFDTHWFYGGWTLAGRPSSFNSFPYISIMKNWLLLSALDQQSFYFKSFYSSVCLCVCAFAFLHLANTLMLFINQFGARNMCHTVVVVMEHLLMLSWRWFPPYLRYIINEALCWRRHLTIYK